MNCFAQMNILKVIAVLWLFLFLNCSLFIYRKLTIESFSVSDLVTLWTPTHPCQRDYKNILVFQYMLRSGVSEFVSTASMIMCNDTDLVR